MYVQRALKKVFTTARRQFPAVLLTGPRQSGKTTFLQHEIKEADYVTFDDALHRSFALQDPNGFLDSLQATSAILDEIQHVPEILPYIKMRIDRDRKPGRWIMTGSQQFPLMKNISETLAGRVAVLELAPFCLAEKAKTGTRALEETVWAGLFPEPACQPEKRDLWIKSYIQTYIERDVRQMESIRNFRAFDMFINLSAAFHAQEFHFAALARDTGVSQPTIKAWNTLLETGYIAIMLQPFYKNFGKRIIKAPKFYFSDPALVCYLTRQPSAQAALSGNMAGALFEGLIVSEVWKAYSNLGKTPAAYFWRSQSGHEVDLIIQAQERLWPIEIKMTGTPTVAHVKPIQAFKKLAGKEAAEQGVVVCRTERKMALPENNIALPWYSFAQWLSTLLS